MEYSSSAGHDMMHGSVYIDAIMSERLAQHFYKNMSEFEHVMDFGSGVYGITVEEVLEKFPNPKLMRKFIGAKNITAQESVTLFNALKEGMGDRPYIV